MLDPFFNTIQVIFVLVAVIAAITTFFVTGLWGLIPLSVEIAAIVGLFIEQQRRISGGKDA